MSSRSARQTQPSKFNLVILDSVNVLQAAVNVSEIDASLLLKEALSPGTSTLTPSECPTYSVENITLLHTYTTEHEPAWSNDAFSVAGAPLICCSYERHLSDLYNDKE